MSKINEVAELVEKGKAKLVGPAVQEAIDEGDDPVAILNDGMISAMSVVGEKFKNGEIFVPEMLVAARAMKKGVEVLKPHLASGSTGALGKVIIATVSGDLHDIGKNLVAMMIESAGFEVIDLGVDVPAAKIIECYKENPDVNKTNKNRLVSFDLYGSNQGNHGTKYNPCYYGDFLGDYREEVILGSSDYRSIYIFSTNHPTTHRLRHLMTDHNYDMSQAMQNMGYNQGTNLGYYVGAETMK